VPICIPAVDAAGKAKRGVWVLTKSRAGEYLLRSARGVRSHEEACIRLVAKLAAGEKLEQHERDAVRLLLALNMTASQKSQHQVMGYKLMERVLGDAPARLTSEDEAKAMQALGLA